MRRTLRFAALAAALTFSTGAIAQPVGIGSTSGGAIAQISASIASVVSSHSGLQMRPQKMTGTQQYIPLVNQGRLEFGVANIMQYNMAVTGTGLSKDKAHPNLRLVASLFPFYGGFLVRKDSGMNTVADVKGHRVEAGYSSGPLFEMFATGFLESVGLSWDDVTPVPVVTVNWEMLKNGQADVQIASVGTGRVQELNAAIPGGVKFLAFNKDDDIEKYLPKTRLAMVEPGPAKFGVDGPTLLHAYEMTLFASADVDDEVVYKVVKALYDNPEALKQTSGHWQAFVPDEMARNYGLPYHPGAEKFYKEKGIFSAD